MSATPRTRRVLSAIAPATVALTVALGLTAAVPADAQAPGPVHAGSEYGWGKVPVNYTFVGPLKKGQFRVKGPGQVRNQHGMLTLNTAGHGTVSATQVTQGHEVGRWEIRLRSRQYEHGHHPYRVLTELVPAGSRDWHCGGKNVALESYTPHHHVATHYIRSLPHHSFNAHKGLTLHDDQWHTFAVEVTRKRISWFVDAHVISTERRNEALTGTPFAVKFTMQGAPHQRMDRSRMQMDWLRYWTLKNPDTKSTAAPRPTAGSYRQAC